VPLDDLLGALVAIPVGRTGGITFDPESSDFARGYGIPLFVEDSCFETGHDAAGGAVTDFSRDIGDEDVESFGGADTIENFEAEAFGKALTDRGGKNLPGRDTEPNAGEIEFAGVAMVVDESCVVGRYGKEERGAMAFNGGENVLR
jgi:hypothetical protein